jgi:hypothetical protein
MWNEVCTCDEVSYQVLGRPLQEWDEEVMGEWKPRSDASLNSMICSLIMVDFRYRRYAFYRSPTGHRI